MPGAARGAGGRGVIAAILSTLRGTAPLDRATLGRRGERAAARALRRKGFRVLDRNVRAGGCEADLVCLDPDRRTIVVVEVKTRCRGGAASPQGRAIEPEASVGERKRRQLLRVSRALASARGWTDRRVRIDVVAVDWPASGTRGRPTVRHHVDAVAPSR